MTPIARDPHDYAAFIVVDLGFGDSGKGLVTDYLVRATGAHTVVRFNGGAQAGHNVVTPEGRHHTFSQLGAGTFVPGVITYLSRFVVVHPTAMIVEATALEGAGVRDPLSRTWVDRDALVTTPFHQALNRIRELSRGRRRHGTCGVGFGETVRDGRVAASDALRAGDLGDPRSARVKLRRAQERCRQAARSLAEGAADVAPGAPGREVMSEELSVFESSELGERWLGHAFEWMRRVHVVPPSALGERLQRPGSVVFEGAQGVLLDERHGFFPHCTFSTCTPTNARLLLTEQSNRSARTLGVARVFLTRHGEGPFPTEDAAVRGLFEERHNRLCPWQGPFRAGWPDLVLLRHAASVSGGIDGLALTHCDVLERAPHWRYCHGYERDPHLDTTSGDLEARRAMTERLAHARPLYRTCASAEVPTVLSRALNVPIALRAHGPTAAHVCTAP